MSGEEKTQVLRPNLRLVAWEITGRCNLRCAHCRASAGDVPGVDMALADSLALIDMIGVVGHPMLILTGGEPLLHPDVFTIASYAHRAGFRVALGTNGTLITDAVATKIRAASIARVAVSLDFPTAREQDQFRGVEGAFEAAIIGIGALRRAGVGVQINTTVSRLNIDRLKDILNLALDYGAVAFHPFFLVPTGRGRTLAGEELSATEYEEALNWIYDQEQALKGRILFKPTDAPHYLRILSQRNANAMPEESGHSLTRGCLCGVGFCFISHLGEVKGCGYLDLVAGRLQEESFASIWYDSPLFNTLRDLSRLEGKCGRCEYKWVCGGCRARAYELTGNYMASEPYCIYEPGVKG